MSHKLKYLVLWHKIPKSQPVQHWNLDLCCDWKFNTYNKTGYQSNAHFKSFGGQSLLMLPLSSWFQKCCNAASSMSKNFQGVSTMACWWTKRRGTPDWLFCCRPDISIIRYIYLLTEQNHNFSSEQCWVNAINRFYFIFCTSVPLL